MSIRFWLATSFLAIGLPILGWLLHRFCFQLEERGYIYYRERPKGGGGLKGAMIGLDQLTRPSVEYVVEMQDVARKEEDEGIGGE